VIFHSISYTQSQIFWTQSDFSDIKPTCCDGDSADHGSPRDSSFGFGLVKRQTVGSAVMCGSIDQYGSYVILGTTVTLCSWALIRVRN
jgi:hypothetical protein